MNSQTGTEADTSGSNCGKRGGRVLYVRCASRGTKAGLRILARRHGLSESAMAECILRRTIATDAEAVAAAIVGDADGAVAG